MMNSFTALMEARDPALGRFRSYRLDAGPDLFGTWLAEVTYGRIGTAGQTLSNSFPSEDAARKDMEKLVKEKLGKGYVDAAGSGVSAIWANSERMTLRSTSAFSEGSELLFIRPVSSATTYTDWRRATSASSSGSVRSTSPQ